MNKSSANNANIIRPIANGKLYIREERGRHVQGKFRAAIETISILKRTLLLLGASKRAAPPKRREKSLSKQPNAGDSRLQAALIRHRLQSTISLTEETVEVSPLNEYKDDFRSVY